MPRLALFHDGTNSALRVTKDVADIPWAVASDDYGKLAFDSLNPNQVVDTDIFVNAWDDFTPVPSNDNWNRYPYGASWSQATHMVQRRRVSGSLWSIWIKELAEHTLDVSFAPMVTMQRRDTGGWTHLNSFRQSIFTYSSGQTIGFEENVASHTLIEPQSEHDFSGYGGYVVTTGNFGNLMNEDAGREDDFHGYWQSRLYWGLPADDSPAQFPVGPSNPGSVIARITNQQVRIARNGYDVNTATPQQLLMRDDASPIRIVAADEVTVPAGGTVDIPLPPGVDYPEEMVVDAICRNVDANVFDHPAWLGNFFSFAYAAVDMRGQLINGDTIRLWNVRPVDAVARYIVTGFDPRPATTGTAKVLAGYQHPSGDYIQIRRPGTGDPPRLADVLFDSRWPYVPIVAQDRWSFQTSGNAGSPETRSHTVNFTNDGGWRPYPLFMAEFDDGTFHGARTQVLIGTGASTPWHRQHARQSFFARITDTSVTFFAHPRHPTALTRQSGTFGWQIVPSSPSAPRPVAIRYYILAVPVST